MSDLNPEGISQDGQFEGQEVRLSKNDVAVDTVGNELAFASPQGTTGFGGVTGILNSAQGITGAIFLGSTGIRGLTGIIGMTGVQGVAGFTGVFGIKGTGFGDTGLTGATGITSITGIIGDTGFRGLVGQKGFTGLVGVGGSQGATGLNNNFIGPTGIQGATGSSDGIQGVTGIVGLGTTGFQGVTGIVGSTGLSGTLHLDAQAGAGISKTVTILADTLSVNDQQIDFNGIGFTTDDAVGTTITLTLGATTLFTKVFGLLSDVFNITGTIIRTGATSQVIGVQLVFDSGVVSSVSTTASETLSSDLSLILSTTSTGDGDGVTKFVVTKIF